MNILYYTGFNFIIYSFFGWIIEEVYCFVINKTFKKDGFLSGPIKPMYGIAMTTLVLLHRYSNMKGIYLAVLFFVIPTTVEYISGYLLKYFFGKTYWTYSNLKFNLNGYVCLKFSIYWMILSFIGVYIFQNILNNFYLIMSGTLLRAIIVLTNIIIALDFMERLAQIDRKFLIRTKK